MINMTNSIALKRPHILHIYKNINNDTGEIFYYIIINIEDHDPGQRKPHNWMFSISHKGIVTGVTPDNWSKYKIDWIPPYWKEIKFVDMPEEVKVIVRKEFTKKKPWAVGR
jgi:hypothetical protein